MESTHVHEVVEDVEQAHCRVETCYVLIVPEGQRINLDTKSHISYPLIIVKTRATRSSR